MCANRWGLGVSGVPGGGAVLPVLPALLMQLRKLLHQAGAKSPPVWGLGTPAVLLQVVLADMFVVLVVVLGKVIMSAGLWVLGLLLDSLTTVTGPRLLLSTDLPTGLLVTLVDGITISLF